VIDRIVDA
jgi:hypothetical protein